MKLLIMAAHDYIPTDRDMQWLQFLQDKHSFTGIVTMWEWRSCVPFDIFIGENGLDWECYKAQQDAVDAADCGALLPGQDMDTAELVIRMRKARKPIGQSKQSGKRCR